MKTGLDSFKILQDLSSFEKVTLDKNMYNYPVSFGKKLLVVRFKLLETSLNSDEYLLGMRLLARDNYLGIKISFFNIYQIKVLLPLYFIGNRKNKVTMEIGEPTSNCDELDKFQIKVLAKFIRGWAYAFSQGGFTKRGNVSTSLTEAEKLFLEKHDLFTL